MNVFHFAIGGALIGLGTLMEMQWNGVGQASAWVWMLSSVFGGLSGAFLALAMRLASPETFDESLSIKQRRIVKLLLVPAVIGTLLLIIGQGTLPTDFDEATSPAPLFLMLFGSVIALISILIGGTMSLIVQLSAQRKTVEPSHAPKDAS